MDSMAGSRVGKCLARALCARMAFDFGIIAMTHLELSVMMAAADLRVALIPRRALDEQR